MCTEIINDYYRDANVERNNIKYVYEYICVYVYICIHNTRRSLSSGYHMRTSELIFIRESLLFFCFPFLSFHGGSVPQPSYLLRVVSSIELIDDYSADTLDAVQITPAAISAIINYSRVRKSFGVDTFSGCR